MELPHRLIRDAEAQIRAGAAEACLTFKHTAFQSLVFRINGSRVCWIFASHGVVQVQFDNISNAPKGTCPEPVYEEFTDSVKAAEYILSLV